MWSNSSDRVVLQTNSSRYFNFNQRTSINPYINGMTGNMMVNYLSWSMHWCQEFSCVHLLSAHQTWIVTTVTSHGDVHVTEDVFLGLIQLRRFLLQIDLSRLVSCYHWLRDGLWSTAAPHMPSRGGLSPSRGSLSADFRLVIQDSSESVQWQHKSVVNPYHVTRHRCGKHQIKVEHLDNFNRQT